MNQLGEPRRRTAAEDAPAEDTGVRRDRRHAVAVVLLRGLRLYSLLACLEVAVTAAIRPDLLGSPSSAWWPHVGQDVLGVFFVVLSCAAWAGLRFLGWPHDWRDND